MSSETTTDRSYERPKQNSPLFKLPVELRIEIYKMALQDNIESLTNSVGCFKRLPPVTNYGSRLLSPLDGALALPHTSSTLHEESMDKILAILRVESRNLFLRKKAINLRSQLNRNSTVAFIKASDTKSELDRIVTEICEVWMLLSAWKAYSP